MAGQTNESNDAYREGWERTFGEPQRRREEFLKELRRRLEDSYRNPGRNLVSPNNAVFRRLRRQMGDL